MVWHTTDCCPPSARPRSSTDLIKNFELKKCDKKPRRRSAGRLLAPGEQKHQKILALPENETWSGLLTFSNFSLDGRNGLRKLFFHCCSSGKDPWLPGTHIWYWNRKAERSREKSKSKISARTHTSKILLLVGPDRRPELLCFSATERTSCSVFSIFHLLPHGSQLRTKILDLSKKLGSVRASKNRYLKQRFWVFWKYSFALSLALSRAILTVYEADSLW